MCGIIGIISRREKDSVTHRLVEGLKRLEYRGYDSAGVGTLKDGKLFIRRAAGKLDALENLLHTDPISGHIGIGHTRWATHGVPSKENAHPHSNGKVSVVHNGIIENYAKIKDRLVSLGYTFSSQTDTEAVVHLLSFYLDQKLQPLEAFQKTLDDIEGAFALAILITGEEDFLFVARNGSPLVIGHGDQEMMVGSDALALSPWVQKIQYLDDGDYAIIQADNASIYNKDHQQVTHPLKETAHTGEAVTKGDFDHFMLKEIFEQPLSVKNTLASFIDPETQALTLSDAIDWTSISRLTIVACGTAYYAASVAKYWFEMLAHLPVEIDIASEFRYREPVLPKDGLSLFISQSGETIDTLMALTLAQTQGQKTVAIVNTPESSIARQADHVFYTLAGPEIGVASTKAFTAQLATLACLVLQAAQKRQTLSQEKIKDYIKDLHNLPTIFHQILQNDSSFQKVAALFKDVQDIIYLGRGISYPIALEAALKLKEISYIHAEGCAAGEIKHGPIALIDSKVPVVILAPHDQWMVKTLSNMQEVVARGGRAICFTDAQGHEKIKADHMEAQVIEIPSSNILTAPLIYSLPMQLIAYHTAVLRGVNVDQPRNLAKSVTVE